MNVGPRSRQAVGIVVAICSSVIGAAVLPISTAFASQYSDTVLSDNPALYWPADEGSGTTLNDLSGGGRSGTVWNAASWSNTGLVSGSPASLVGLGGLNGYASTQPGQATGLPLGPTRTVEFWFSSSDANAWPEWLFSFWGGGNAGGGEGTDRWTIAIQANSAISVDDLLWGQSEYGVGCSSSTYFDGKPHLVDYTGDGTTNRLYIDGTECANHAQLNNNSWDHMCGVAIGAGANVACGFAGPQYQIASSTHVGQVSVYAATLTPAQIANHHSAGAGGAVRYQPSINGYAFNNPGAPLATVPSYDRMASFYPSSRFEIFYPFTDKPTFLAHWFNSNYFVSAYSGGLCYGMAASDQFLYNTFPDQSAVTLYPSFPGAPGSFPGALGASPSPSDTNIEQFIDRYHSRQMAAAGVEASIGTWEFAQLTGGNRGALDTIATAVASGKTEWVGLGPSREVLTETSNPIANKDRFSFLLNESHAVLAYRVDQSQGRIDIYDPNSPLDDQAYIKIVGSSINPGGGIEVVHNGDDSVPANISYGGGISPSGTDFGQSGEWQMMPLPQAAFTDQGNVPPFDNRHWMLDLVSPIALIAGARLSKLLGEPIFRMLGSNAQDPMESELLPSGSGLDEVIATDRPGAQTSLKSGSSATDVIETDDTAGGTTHHVSISPDATQVVLSNASSVQRYTATLGSDFLPSPYGRSITISGAILSPGGTLDLRTDPTYSTFAVAASAMPGGQANLLLQQLGQGEGSASVTVTVPGSGSQGVVFVGDWTGLGQSLIFEVITGPNGQVTGLLLQDNAGQRQRLSDQLLESIQAAITKVTDAGVRNSLQAKLDNAAKQIGEGDPGTAANVLEALDHEVAAQTGLAIPTDLATSLTASLAELIGLQRTASV